MKQTLRGVLAAVLAGLVLAAATVPAFAQNTVDYTLVSPYDSVDWDSWDYYKANLHTHSTYSDGEFTLPDMVEKYYALGYDILAMTDHGVINPGWTEDRKTYPPFDWVNHVEGHEFSYIYHTEAKMTPEDYERITTGSDRGGRGMVDVTGGIEMNMAVISKTHVNAYFTEYGSGRWGTENDYAGAVEGVEKSGKGYTVLNHVGDWLKSHNHPERAHDPVNIAYFADIMVRNPSCLGMEIINNKDRVTRSDRALWDELLSVVIPTGRTVIAFADDDSEIESDIGNSYEMFVLPENNLDEVRKARVNGCFFCGSRFDNTDPEDRTEGEIGGAVPLVSDIEWNDAENTVTLTFSPDAPCDKVTWVSAGADILVQTDPGTSATIDLNDFDGRLGNYVRFKLNNDQGVTYSQAMELRYEGRPEPEIPYDATAKYQTFFGRIIMRLYQTRAWAIFNLIKEKIWEKKNNI